MSATLASGGVLVRRALNEVVRVPAAAIPGVLAPAIFLAGLSSVFGSLTRLRGFPTDQYVSFLLPVAMMQAASFTGAATGVNLARDIEQGWFDRLLVAPLSRPLILASTVASAAVRALLPMSFTLVVGIALGGGVRSADGLIVAILLALGFAVFAATWTSFLALRFRTQSAAPLMQASVFILVLFTTSYAPQRLLTGMLADIARWNPVTRVVDGVRQGFVGELTFATTWHALAVEVGLVALAAVAALRLLARTGS